MNAPETPKELSARIAEFGPDPSAYEKNPHGQNRRARRAAAAEQRRRDRQLAKLREKIKQLDQAEAAGVGGVQLSDTPPSDPHAPRA